MQPTYTNAAAFYADSGSYSGPGSLLLDGRPVWQASVNAPALNYYTQYDATINKTYPGAQPGPLASSYLSRILFGVNVLADKDPTPISLDEGQYLVKAGTGTPRKYYVQETGGRGGGVSTTPITGWKDGTLHASYPSRDSCTANILAYNGPEIVTRDGSMVAHPGQTPNPYSPFDPANFIDYRSQSDGSLKRFKYDPASHSYKPG